MTAGDVVLDASCKGIPYGVRTRLADLGAHGWNVPAGDLPLPVMTLDQAAVENNIAAMAAYCARHGVRLSPHGKTTMSPQLFRRQLDAGAWAITAATPGQAALMRDSGIGRILLANELVDPNALRWLAGEYRRDPDFELLFLVDHPAAVRLADLARILHERGLARGGEFLISAGGSIFFDRVVAAFTPLRAEIPGLEIVLRSGGYVSHDAGRHRRLSPLDGRRAEGESLRLREALTLWGSVLSVPADGRAIVGVGKRDAPFDIELPVPQRLYRAGLRDAPADLATARVAKLMDQHALVDLDPEQPIAPGDIMSFGVSHPCAAFDRWRFLPLIDADGTVVDGVTTGF